ncbi:CHAT domain-containing protein [Promicromonospora sukumoe]|uniref:CHAT domain-containing protein n=1 Tax=Promicromonospora sukumoe TaxID=88382 RepID=UPI00365D03D1
MEYGYPKLDFSPLRMNWFESVARLVNEKAIDHLDTWEHPIAEALARLTTIAGHFSGHPDSNLELQAGASSFVQSEIKRWRSGRVHPRIARYWKSAWRGLTQYAIAESLLTTGQLNAVLKSPAYASLISGSQSTETAILESGDILKILDRRGIHLSVDSALAPPGGLELGPNHLAVVREVVASLGVQEAVEIFSEFEVASALPDNELDAILDRWLFSSKQSLRHWLIDSGSWSGSAHELVPDHVVDWVIRRHGRIGHSTTGMVPGWFATAESQSDLMHMRRLGYSGGMSIRADDDTFRITVHALDEDGSTPILRAEYLYSTDPQSLQDLAILAAMHFVLFDLYQLTESRELRHSGTWNIPVPMEIVDKIIDWLRPRFTSLDLDAALDSLPSHREEASLRVEAAESRRHEVAHLVRERIEGRLTASMRKSLSDYLDAIQRASSMGYYAHADPVGAELRDAHSAMRSLINDTRKIGHLDIDLALQTLGPGRAILYFEPNIAASEVVAGWIDADGVARHDWFDMPDMRTHVNAGELESLAALKFVLSNIAAELRRQGIEHVVLSPPPTAYTLPWHQAFLELGFRTASYAPSLRLLQPIHRERTENFAVDNVIAGWSGRGKAHIPGVSAELAAVRRLYGDSALRSLPPEGGHLGFLHLAGHGHAGYSEAISAIQLGADSRVSGYHVLANMELIDTELVVLSGCSTGAASYTPLQLQENTPLDTCFLAAGVTAAVSTSHPVEDFVALLFSTEFHSRLAAGEPLWRAYQFGCKGARLRVREGLSPTAAETLDEVWPEWGTVVIPRESENDWLAFRLSGRYWDVGDLVPQRA